MYVCTYMYIYMVYYIYTASTYLERKNSRSDISTLTAYEITPKLYQNTWKCMKQNMKQNMRKCIFALSY